MLDVFHAVGVSRVWPVAAALKDISLTPEEDL